MNCSVAANHVHVCNLLFI